MPTHNITLTGDVQDVGLHHLIAELGEQEGRRGFVYNEADGTVRIVTSGTREQADAFIGEIRSRSASLSAAIESAEVEVVNGEVSLPSFVAPPTDDLADINRKLGNGIRTLTSIEEDTDRLTSIEENTHRLSSIEENTDRLPRIEENTDRLSSIEENTDRLPRIEENTDRLPSIEENTEKLVNGQERMIEILDERL